MGSEPRPEIARLDPAAGPEPRPEIARLEPVVHGGGAPAGVADFSTGVSPLPAPAEILDAARGADLARYPDASALPFRKAAADLHGVSEGEIAAGAGSVEIIWALARAFAGPGRTGVVVTPAFGEYEQALRASGAAVAVAGAAPPRLEPAPGDIERALALGAAIVFLGRPANPGLGAISAGALAALARRWPRTLFVVDEAYQPMFEGVEPTPIASNVAVLRSLTKVFALPGLRLGYLRASPAVASAVRKVLPPWNVSAPAQAAGVVAARLLPAQASSIRARIAALRAALEQALRDPAGLPVRAGGPFLLYRVGGADVLARRLLERGVMVRSCASFALPDHVRVGVRAEADNAKLAAAWRGIAAPG